MLPSQTGTSEHTPNTLFFRSRRQLRKWGKTPGTQVQHTLNFGTIDTEFRHFSTIDFVTVQIGTKSARGFAPLTGPCRKPLNLLNIRCIRAPTPLSSMTNELRVCAARSRRTIRYV